jgi:GMP synthase-like glutamine amidotransferase
MRSHYLQHVPFEGLGSIEPWLKAAGHKITGTHFYEAADLPDLDEFDLLVIMGGPMSVNDEHEFSWLLVEKDFIRRAIEAGKSVLGICLGAQLIANAMGSRVYRKPFKEIGWFPIYGMTVPDRKAFCFPPRTEVFHWHGETFDLPVGAIQLAGNEATENQAFQLGRSVIGLQFHLETTPDSVHEIFAHLPKEPSPSKYVQPKTAILSVPPEKYLAINHLMGEVLSYLIGGDG